MSDERPGRVNVALAGIAAVHLGLLAYFAPPRTMLAKEPVLSIDYALHAYQVDRALDAWRQAHALWGWDPQQLAGQPVGIVEDLTSKGTELWVIGATALGVHPALAYNLLIVLVHLALPVVAWAAARLFGLGRGAAAVNVGLWVGLWWFDSFMHWCWWIGMISWAFTSFAGVLLIALLYRTLAEPRAARFAGLGVLGAVITLAHPFSVMTLLLPCLVLYARSFRALALRWHLAIAACTLAAGATVLVWIFPALRFRHYIGDADVFFRPHAEGLLYDYLDLLKDGANTGAQVRTMLRTLCFAAGLVGLWRWKKASDPRVLPLATAVVAGIALAYLSGYLWIARQTQPYRQIGPAMLAASIPASALLAELLAPGELKRLGAPARLLLGLALFLIVPRFARNVLQYFPAVVPIRPANAHDLVDGAALQPASEAEVTMRHEGPPARFRALRAWLLANHAGRGRVVVSEWVVGEYLATATPFGILGGIVERNVPHVDAHLFRLMRDGNPMLGDELRRYFERYAVGWVVLGGDHAALDYRPDALVPHTALEGFRIYRTRIEPSWFLRGAGVLESQSLNKLRVSHATGTDVVLRFHWMETLRCRPGCEVEREAIPGDRVGFIRVPAPPSSFEIYNAY